MIKKNTQLVLKNDCITVCILRFPLNAGVDFIFPEKNKSTIPLIAAGKGLANLSIYSSSLFAIKRKKNS